MSGAIISRRPGVFGFSSLDGARLLKITVPEGTKARGEEALSRKRTREDGEGAAIEFTTAGREQEKSGRETSKQHRAARAAFMFSNPQQVCFKLRTDDTLSAERTEEQEKSEARRPI